MPLVENLDFLNANTLRNYPIKESLPKTDSNGNFTIPDDFIVDIALAATATPTARFYISRIINLANLITVELSDIAGNYCGAFNIDTATHTLYKEYYLTASTTGNYVDANGKLVVASVESLGAAPAGVFVFPPESTELEMCTILPTIASTSRFIFRNADDGLVCSLSGDVVLVARTNVRFKQIDAHTVAIDAGEGLGLNKACADSKPCIKTINGISPAIDGNFTMAVSDCASLTPISGSSGGLLLKDTCCKPCLGCDEIGELTSRLMQIENDLITLKNHYQEVSTLSSQFNTIINASCSC